MPAALLLFVIGLLLTIGIKRYGPVLNKGYALIDCTFRLKLGFLSKLILLSFLHLRSACRDKFNNIIQIPPFQLCFYFFGQRTLFLSSGNDHNIILGFIFDRRDGAADNFIIKQADSGFYFGMKI